MAFSTRFIGSEKKEDYNRFVADCPKGHILQSYEWGEVKAATGWKPWRMVVEKNGRPAAAISILERSVPVLGKKIFYAPRGPVLDIHNYELFDYLLGEIRSLAVQRGAMLLKLDPDVPSSDIQFTSYLEEKGFKSQANKDFEGIQPRYVFRLDITQDLEDIFNSFHHKTRYNIRLAERRGVKVRVDCTREDLRSFYDILEVTSERDNFLVRSFSYFETLWKCLVENGLARLFMAEYEGRPIAGTLAFIFGDQAWYIYGASSNEHRNVMPNYLLQWEMIAWAKENGCRLYDFRGVPGNLTEDNPLYGLYRFKKGFKGEYIEFVGEYDLVYSPAVYKAYLTLEPVYSRGIRKLIRLRKRKTGGTE